MYTKNISELINTVYIKTYIKKVKKKMKFKYLKFIEIYNN